MLDTRVAAATVGCWWRRVAHRSKRREEEALGEELAHEAPARRAERRADGDLAGAARGPGDHEARHVGAGDEEDEQARREHGVEELMDLVVEHRFVERPDDGFEPLVGL